MAISVKFSVNLERLHRDRGRLARAAAGLHRSSVSLTDRAAAMAFRSAQFVTNALDLGNKIASAFGG